MSISTSPQKPTVHTISSFVYKYTKLKVLVYNHEVKYIDHHDSRQSTPTARPVIESRASRRTRGSNLSVHTRHDHSRTARSRGTCAGITPRASVGSQPYADSRSAGAPCSRRISGASDERLSDRTSSRASFSGTDR